MKKHTFFTMLCVLLVLTGCQKRQEQTDIRLPESDSAVTEETITEPTEKAEEALSEESHAEQEPQSTVPDLGDYENLCAVLQTLQTLDDWKSNPEYEMITAQKEKVLSQLIGSFYHGLDSLSLQNTAAIMICPVWRLRCSGVCLGRKIWSWKPRRRLNGSGPGLSGHSDTFMKRTQQDCRRSIRLPLPQSIRLWIITGHGKMR